MFFVETCGSAYEMGRQFGRATALAIGATLDLLAKRFRHWDGRRFRRARERHMACTERLCPELIEEVSGIADGAGLPLHWVYIANFYTCMRAGLEGCSNFIFTRTPDGPLLAKTNDLPVAEGKHAGVRLLRPKGGPAMLVATWPGTVWGGAGVSEAGLAIGGSSCSTRLPAPDEFLDPHAVGRFLLGRAQSVEDALSLLEPIAFSPWGANTALLDRTGTAAIVEKAGTAQAVRRPTGKRIWCTNHPVTHRMSPHAAADTAALQESVGRYDAINRLTRSRRLTAELAKRVLSYEERPGALCRWGDDDPLRYETEFSCILYPAQLRAEFCFSHASRDPWHGFSLRENPPDRTEAAR